MLQPSTTALPPTGEDCTALLAEQFEAITESDVVLDEGSWLALLIQIDRAEDGP
jgi:hypothetical protein